MGTRRRIAAMITLSEPYKHHFEVFTGIRKYALEQGWDCSAKPYAESDFTDNAPHAYDGVVGRITPPMLKAASRFNIPLANVYMNTKLRTLPSVFLDTQACARMAGKHLIERGFRHFAFIGIKGEVFSRMVQRHLWQIVTEQGYPCHPLFVSAYFDQTAHQHERFQEELHRWIATLSPPIGVVAGHDLLAYYLIEACREQGLRVPFEIGVVGTHNEQTICSSCEPTLSSIEFNFEKVGYMASQLLGQLMDGQPAPAEPLLVQPRQLYVRGSSDAAVVDDPRVARALQFIADNSRRPLTVEAVAKHVHTSSRTLARLFQKAMGRSIYSEISRFRVEYIKRQLVDTDIPVNKLAILCGFSSSSHLSRLFQSVEGIRPGEYRRRMS